MGTPPAEPTHLRDGYPSLSPLYPPRDKKISSLAVPVNVFQKYREWGGSAPSKVARRDTRVSEHRKHGALVGIVREEGQGKLTHREWKRAPLDAG